MAFSISQTGHTLMLSTDGTLMANLHLHKDGDIKSVPQEETSFLSIGDPAAL